jgi:CRISPR-associated protein (TIGR02584 family)
MRPAILTSTIWALAHESPPVIPDRVVAVTTVAGREAIRRELFTPPAVGQPCVWDALRSALAAQGHDLAGRLVFGDTGEDLRVFTAPDASARSQELDDLRTAAHYEQAADFLLDVVRTLTEVDDTRLIASVSGGRKPLVSLLAGALGFLGGPQDRLVHALVNEPFDSPTLRPPFFFPPQPPSKHRFFDANAGVERLISSTAAELDLVDVPFVRLRRLFASEPQLYRSRYSVLARAYSDRLSQLTGPIELAFNDTRGVLSVNGHPVELRGREHPFFAFLFERWQQGTLPYVGHDRAYPHLLAFLGRWKTAHPNLHFERDDEDWLASPRLDDIARLLAALRVRLGDAGLENATKRLFPIHGPVGLPLPPETAPADGVGPLALR